MKSTAKKRNRLFMAQGGRCWWCDVPMIQHPAAAFRKGGSLQSNACTLDHVTPRSKGGSNDISNLVAACHACNMVRCKIDCIQDTGKKPVPAQLAARIKRAEHERPVLPPPNPPAPPKAPRMPVMDRLLIRIEAIMDLHPDSC